MNSGWNQTEGVDSGHHEVNREGDQVGLENFEFRELLGAIGGCTTNTNNEYSYGSHQNTASVDTTGGEGKPVEEDDQHNVALFSNEWGKTAVNQTKEWDLSASPQHSPNAPESGTEPPEPPVEQPPPSTVPMNPTSPEHWNYKSRIGTWGQEDPTPITSSNPRPQRGRSRVVGYLHGPVAPDNSMRNIRMYRPRDPWAWDC